MEPSNEDRCIGARWASVSGSFSWLLDPPINSSLKQNIICFHFSNLRDSSSVDLSISSSIMVIHSFLDFLASSSTVNWICRIGAILEQDCYLWPNPSRHFAQGERQLCKSPGTSSEKSCGQQGRLVIIVSIRQGVILFYWRKMYIWHLQTFFCFFENEEFFSLCFFRYI